MPFGMGPAGWYFWPHFSYWLSQTYPYPYPPYPGFMSEEQEIEMLEAQAEYFEDQLNKIRKRLDELKKKNK